MFQVTADGDTTEVAASHAPKFADRSVLGTVYADVFMLRPNGERVPLSTEPLLVGRLTL